MSDFASQVSEKDHNEVSDFVPFEVSDFVKKCLKRYFFHPTSPCAARNVVVLEAPREQVGTAAWTDSFS